MAQRARLQAFFSGMVQGVNFRYWTTTYARGLRVTGYVKNLFDGRVELVAEGQGNLLEELLSQIKGGRLGRYIDDVQLNWDDYTGEFEAFDIRF